MSGGVGRTVVNGTYVPRGDDQVILDDQSPASLDADVM